MIWSSISVSDYAFQPRVLVIDDNAFSRTVVARTFQNLGVESVAGAENGIDALRYLESQSVDLILCDLNMPEMDGIEFLRHLSESGYRGNIVLVSGEDRRVLDTVENLAQAHRLNVLGALEKPIGADSLSRLLKDISKDKPEALQRAVERVTRDDLAAAIENGELVVFYEPKISVAGKKLIGVECLVRWRRKDGSIVPPGMFIPLAEECGLVEGVTRTVIQQAIRQADIWAKQGFEIKVAVNLSVLNLQNTSFPDFVSELLAATSVAPGNLILEITETQIMQDVLAPLETLTRLRLKGLSLSIDDFGTGYSSLEQLKRIPFTEMKIDRAFVRGAANDPSARAILESSVNLGRRLGMHVVAEGVETEADWDLVACLGIDTVQGYFFAQPMPADRFLAWVQEFNGQ